MATKEYLNLGKTQAVLDRIGCKVITSTSISGVTYFSTVKLLLRNAHKNELSSETDDSLGIGITKLFVETPKKTPALAKKLIKQAKQELTDESLKQKVLAFIQTVVVYKLPNVSAEEIEAMLNLSDDIKNTAFYQSILKKTKLEVVPILLERGLSIQEVAESLKLDVEEVRKAAGEL
ncbi:DUF2887 domain-containing protein [Scytonema sp. UIC 10036]|uniref:DUF2887 domain-containing protein n=1 Tax=Scytonema sp. UIC 10036 TaxID=2304196 RepID=UPI0012DAB638|nr:DUF2887 domain-containing protein [Scytonema sp. UIC 10036]MUG94368.1 DUF2887 domain-containing protein [Scytonema sp. UIC 10036]